MQSGKFGLLAVSLMLVSGLQAVNAAEINISGYSTLKATYGPNKDSNGQGQVDYANGYATDNVDFSTSQTVVGVQFDASVSDKLDVTVIIQGRGGVDNNFNVNFDWAYADYNFNDQNKLRLGRFKGPFYMISEYEDVGYAYPWVTPPLEVYSTNPINSINGLSYIFQSPVGKADFLFELYGGNGDNITSVPPIVADDMGMPQMKGQQIGFRTDDTIGFNSSIGNDFIKFRLGYMSTKVSNPDFGMTNVAGSFGGLGLIIDWHNFVAYTEYVNRNTDPAMAAAFPDQSAWYVTLGFRAGDALPYFTYASMDDGDEPSRYTLKQTSYTLGFRYEIGESADVKFEASHILPGESGDSNGSLGYYGLFDSPVQDNKGNVLAASFDIIF